MSKESGYPCNKHLNRTPNSLLQSQFQVPRKVSNYSQFFNSNWEKLWEINHNSSGNSECKKISRKSQSVSHSVIHFITRQKTKDGKHISRNTKNKLEEGIHLVASFLCCSWQKDSVFFDFSAHFSTSFTFLGVSPKLQRREVSGFFCGENIYIDVNIFMSLD